jgi:hypothetical protein
MQACEGKLHLGFHAHRAHDAAVSAAGGDEIQERRLADAGLSTQHERPAVPGTHVVQQLAQRLALGAATT